MKKPAPDPLRTQSASTPFKRTGKAPLYLELARWLEHKLESGDYPKGSKIPGDNQVAADLGVSIITVRAAMRVLLDKHLIARYPGKGTFVLDNPAVGSNWGLGSIDDLVTIGFHASVELLDSGYVRPPPHIAEKFGHPANRKLFCCRTLRSSQGEPFVVTDVYLPPPIAARIEKIDLAAALKKKRLINTIVQETCDITITDIHQTMGAELAQAHIAKPLRVKTGTPVLTVERDYFTVGGTLVQVGRANHRVDHYKYTIDLKRVSRSSSH